MEYTQEEIKFLQDNYQNMTNKEMANKLGRSLKSVEHKTKQLKLHKNNKITEEDLQYIKDNSADMSFSKIGEKLGFSYVVIKYYCNKLGLPKQHLIQQKRLQKIKEDKRKNHIDLSYTTLEDDYIRRCYNVMTNKQIGRILNRSAGSISKRCKKLHLKKTHTSIWRHEQCSKCGRKLVIDNNIKPVLCKICSKPPKIKTLLEIKKSNLRQRLGYIKKRCYLEHTKEYKNYGGRGIKVADCWMGPSSKPFVDYCIENGFEIGLQIDRINNNGNYEPGNIRFVDRKTQCRNKRTNKIYKAFGEEKTLVEWSEDNRCIVPYSSLTTRLRWGWDFEESLMTPLNSVIHKSR